MTEPWDPRYVHLTFDDGPHPESTPALLDALVRSGQTATFFIWGEHAVAYPELLRAIHSSGMTIGNHSFTHAHLPVLAPWAVADEIARTQRTVLELTGVLPTLFRPPYGETGPEIRAAAEQAGLAETLWEVDIRDWAGAGANAIVRSAESAGPGDIVLLHDGGYRSTVEAVPRILRSLSARGLLPAGGGAGE